MDRRKRGKKEGRRFELLEVPSVILSLLLPEYLLMSMQKSSETGETAALIICNKSIESGANLLILPLYLLCIKKAKPDTVGVGNNYRIRLGLFFKRVSLPY